MSTSCEAAWGATKTVRHEMARVGERWPNLRVAPHFCSSVTFDDVDDQHASAIGWAEMRITQIVRALMESARTRCDAVATREVDSKHVSTHIL